MGKKRKKEKKRKERRKGAEEDRMKNRKEKERKKSWDQVFNGSVVSAPASQAKGRGSFPSCDRSYCPTSFFGFCR